MTIRELVIEMKLLERRLTLYEEKYGVLSEDFYTALMSGSLAEYDEYDETRTDFSRWKGIYEIWRRKQSYTESFKSFMLFPFQQLLLGD
jgi:hypothetical protein